MAEETGSVESGQPEGGQQQEGQQESQQGASSLLGTGQSAEQPPEQQGSQQGSQQSNPFLDQIKDETIRADPSLQSIQSMEDLAKSYVHAQHLVGKDKVALPSSDDDTEAWNDVLTKLGRPDDPSKYELPGVAEDSQFQPPEGMEDQFKSKAHELGLTNKQARDLWGWYVQDVAEKEIGSATERMEQQKQEAERTLRQEWGNAFDDRVADAQRAIKGFAGDNADQVLQALNNTGLANDPAVLKFLAQAGETLREDTVGGSAKPAGRSPQAAQGEIQQLQSDPQFMSTYMDKNKPGHDDAVARMQKLYQDAFPNQ